MSKQAILANYPDAARWAFGDGPALADELLELVLSGDKPPPAVPMRAIAGSKRR